MKSAYEGYMSVLFALNELLDGEGLDFVDMLVLDVLCNSAGGLLIGEVKGRIRAFNVGKAVEQRIYRLRAKGFVLCGSDGYNRYSITPAGERLLCSLKMAVNEYFAVTNV